MEDLSNDYAGRGVTRAYLINYDFIFENGTIVHGSNVTFGKETSTGQWKFIGGPAGSNAGSNNTGVIGSTYIGNNAGCILTFGRPNPIPIEPLVGFVFNPDGSVTINSADGIALHPSGSPTINPDGSYVFRNCSRIVVTKPGSTSSSMNSFYVNSSRGVTISSSGSPTINPDGSYVFGNCGPIVITNFS